MQLLPRPALFHEFNGEPVEQFGMRRCFGLRAELVDRFHDAATEESLPGSIDDNAGGERVVFANQPAGEGESVGGFTFRKLGEDRRNGGGHLFFSVEVLTAVMATRRAWIVGRAFSHHHGGGRRGALFFERFERGPGLGHFLGRTGIGNHHLLFGCRGGINLRPCSGSGGLL